MKILFVCLGNICRSPLAEGIFLDLVSRQGLSVRFQADSAGTAGYHEGDLPDPRSRKTAQAHGFTLDHRGRQVTAGDLSDFDLILAMDRSNYQHLVNMARNEGQKNKIRLLRDWDPQGTGEVPDPYYGGMMDFEEVYDICLRSLRELLKDLTTRGAD